MSSMLWRLTVNELPLIDGKCCTTWTLIVGVKPGPCGLCGQVPTLVPGTERTLLLGTGEAEYE